MNQFISDYKAKMIADFHLFVEYWYVWIGVIAVLTGGLWFVNRLKGDRDE